MNSEEIIAKAPANHGVKFIPHSLAQYLNASICQAERAAFGDRRYT